MNTTEKGTSFELLVKDLVKQEIDQGTFGIAGNHYKMYHQKKYYSRDRKAYIKVDLAIEFKRTKTSKPSLYILIECKDYGKAVPVDDLEEWFVKAQQIVGMNSKVMLFSRSSFQKGAFEFAKSKGMAAVRILDDDSLCWMIERSSKEVAADAKPTVVANVMNALLNENFVSTNHDTFALLDRTASYSVHDILKKIAREIVL